MMGKRKNSMQPVKALNTNSHTMWQRKGGSDKLSKTKPIENRIDTIFIHVTDLKRSVDWYSRLLGLDVNEDTIQSPIFTFDMGPGRPGLTLDDHGLEEVYDYQPSNQPLFIFSTEDIDSAYQHVKNMGAESISNIQTFPDLSEFTFKDLDGNILMVCNCFS